MYIDSGGLRLIQFPRMDRADYGDTGEEQHFDIAGREGARRHSRMSTPMINRFLAP